MRFRHAGIGQSGIQAVLTGGVDGDAQRLFGQRQRFASLLAADQQVRQPFQGACRLYVLGIEFALDRRERLFSRASARSGSPNIR